MKNNILNVKHGLSNTRFYRTYMNVMTRGKNSIKKPKSYIGINCEWNSFSEFKLDMYESYIKHSEMFGENDTSIDRIDGKKGYSKDNCRWATRKMQSENRSCTLKYNGELCKDICDKLGLKYNTFIYRVKRGSSIQNALFLIKQ